MRFDAIYPDPIPNSLLSTVRCDRHFLITGDIPDGWYNMPMYQNFRNTDGQLCGFIQMETENGNKYLTTTVW